MSKSKICKPLSRELQRASDSMLEVVVVANQKPGSMEQLRDYLDGSNTKYEVRKTSVVVSLGASEIEQIAKQDYVNRIYQHVSRQPTRDGGIRHFKQTVVGGDLAGHIFDSRETYK